MASTHSKHAIDNTWRRYWKEWRMKNKTTTTSVWNSLNVLKGMQLLMIWMLKWSNGQTVYHFCGIYFFSFSRNMQWTGISVLHWIQIEKKKKPKILRSFFFIIAIGALSIVFHNLFDFVFFSIFIEIAPTIELPDTIKNIYIKLKKPVNEWNGA